MIQKILIANRGEIALRIQRTAHRLGISTVAIFSAADRQAAFVQQTTDAVYFEGTALSDTYLNIEKIIAAAQKTGADAIHPGYGFLSENPDFADACNQAGIIFIGPGKDAMQAMGNKITARTTALKAGIPVIPGSTGTPDELLKNAHQAGFPVLIKAAAGGGGKGMRVVRSESGFTEAIEATAREAQAYFGDNTVYIEKYIEAPRHIEVQVLGDQHGNLVHLFERECSLQRRHQKIIEEAPSPTLTLEVRRRICEAAVALAESIHYYSAGTMEFLVDASLDFYFLEMNTRIQVEHPVTELTTGIDIVEQQIYIANGEQLLIRQEDLLQKGHAIECRVYAEDPEQNFLPSPGQLRHYREPAIAAPDPLIHAIVRVDGMEMKSGDIVSADFDPMISKLIVWDSDREHARQKMLSALSRYHIKGINTNIDFLTGMLQHPDFISNNISTRYIDEHREKLLDERASERQKKDKQVLLAAGLLKSFEPTNPNGTIWQHIGYWRHSKLLPVVINGQYQQIKLVASAYPEISFEYEGRPLSATLKHASDLDYLIQLEGREYPVSLYEIKPGHYEVGHEGFLHKFTRNDISTVDTATFSRQSGGTADPGHILSPMPGKVIKLNVQKGDTVKKGDLLLIVEAMKMENNIISPSDAVIADVLIAAGDRVTTSTKLLDLDYIP